MATIAMHFAAVALGANPYIALGMQLVGSLIDKQIFKNDVTTARMDNTQLQNSSYGLIIPLVWGLARIPGNFIYASNFTSHSSGGKGGTGDQEETTYTISAAVGICQGPIAGIRRLWVDGSEYVPNSAGATWLTTLSNIVANCQKTGESLQTALQAYNGTTVKYLRSSDTSKSFTCRVYLGTDIQTPDSYMETQRGGVGFCPGYRDLAYIMMQDKNLADYGNRVPQIQFEVVTTDFHVSTSFAGDETHEGLTYDGVDFGNGLFTNGTFTDCTFTNCRFDNSDWSNATLSGCNFTGSVLRDSIWNVASIDECNFNSTDMRGANLKTANITSTTFISADLRGAEF